MTQAERRYQLIATNEDTGNVYLLSTDPMTRAEAVCMMGKQSNHAQVRYELDPVSVSQTESQAMVEFVAIELGARLGLWRDRRNWVYVTMEIAGRTLSVGVSDGGVVSVNGDPFTLAPRTICNTRRAVKLSITCRLPIQCGMKPVQSVNHEGVLCTLVENMNNQPVLQGQTLCTGEQYYLIEGGQAPHKDGSTGRVFTDRGAFGRFNRSSQHQVKLPILDTH